MTKLFITTIKIFYEYKIKNTSFKRNFEFIERIFPFNFTCYIIN